MAPPRTGYVLAHGDHWAVRIRLRDGKKSPRIHLEPGLTREQAEAEALEHQREYDAEQAAPAPPPAKVDGPTLAAWADLWFADRARRGLTDERGRWDKWVTPRLGHRPAKGIETEELEAFVEHLDTEVREGRMGAKNATNVWTLVSAAFKAMSRSKTLALRLRRDNPAAGVVGPDAAPEKAKQFLYPSEALQLFQCAAVPVSFRQAATVAIYLYLRTAEQRPLGWAPVDLAHRAVLIHETEDRTGERGTTKGKASRRVPIEATLAPLLEAIKAEGGELVTPLEDDHHLSRNLRRWLRRAGVERAELFAQDATRKAITWHDLRATGITWCAIRGDEPLRIMQRAGHKRFETTMGYVREAENLRDGFGEVFPELPLEALGVKGRDDGEEQDDLLRGDEDRGRLRDGGAPGAPPDHDGGTARPRGVRAPEAHGSGRGAEGEPRGEDLDRSESGTREPLTDRASIGPALGQASKTPIKIVEAPGIEAGEISRNLGYSGPVNESGGAGIERTGANSVASASEAGPDGARARAVAALVAAGDVEGALALGALRSAPASSWRAEATRRAAERGARVVEIASARRAKGYEPPPSWRAAA